MVPKGEKDSLRDFKREAHKYSGLNPELYYTFTNELDMHQATMSSPRHLYLALDALEELALYTRGTSSGVRDEVRILVCNLGDAAELELILKGVRFTPKYLKETPFVQ